MRLADFTRLHSNSGPASGHPDDFRVNGFCVTPVEGLDTDEVPKVPLQPEDVLALLKARLALDEKFDTLATSWPPVSGVRGKTPSCPDITPSPIVIGIDDPELKGQPTPDTIALESTEEWREPAAKDTPAEPIASARVRQANRPRAASTPLPADASRAEAIIDSEVTASRESIIERLYFPPMKPPESWQDFRANEPLVHVVPDCDAKMRTARSLRRPSGRPAYRESNENRGYRWALTATVAGLAIALIIGIARTSSTRLPQSALAGPREPNSSSIESHPAAGASTISIATSPSTLLDSGAVSLPVGDWSASQMLAAPPPAPTLPSNSTRLIAPVKTPGLKVHDRLRGTKQAKPSSAKGDSLVF